MNFAIATVIEFFKAQSWGYREDEARPIVYTGINGQNGQWRCFASANNDARHLVFISIFPIQARPKKRAKCAELLTRINYGLLQGCFEMDFEDGEIRFRTSFGPLDTSIPVEQIENLIFANLAIMDRYFAPIIRVLYTSERPDQALGQAHEFLIPPFTRFSLN